MYVVPSTRARLGVLFLAVIATVLLTSGCERRDRDVSAVLAADSADAGPSQTSWDVNFDLQEGGKRRARFIADKMEHFDTDDSSYVLLTMQSDSAMRSVLQEVSGLSGDRDPETAPSRTFAGADLPPDRVLTYVFEEGDSSAAITATRMMFFADEGRFEAFGDVEVLTTESKQLFSEQLTWDQTERKIRTRRFVRIITPSETVQGNGLLADEDLDTYQIGRFTANVDIDDEEGGEREKDADEDGEAERDEDDVDANRTLEPTSNPDANSDTTSEPSAVEPDSAIGSYVDP